MQFNRRKMLAFASAGTALSLAVPARSQEVLPVYNTALQPAAPNVLTPMTVGDLSSVLSARSGAISVHNSGACFAGTSYQQPDVIALREFNSITVNQADQTLTVGPAAKLSTINQTLRETGLALPAGYCQNIAIGGNALGGGIGILSRAHGLACDNLLDADVVLTNGKVIKNTAQNAPDLFWGLRGGGGSLAVMTQATFQLHPVERMRMFQTRLSLPIEGAAKLIRYIGDFMATAPNRLSGIIYINADDGKNIRLRIRFTEIGTGNTALDFFNTVDVPDFRTHDPIAIEGLFDDIANRIWPKNLNPARPFILGSDYAEMLPSEDQFLSVLDIVRANRAHRTSHTIEFLGGQINETATTNTAYPHRTANLIHQYQLGIQDANKQFFLQSIMSEMKQAIGTSLIQGQYLNYPDPFRYSDRSSYWLDNFDRLKNLKNKYDPDNKLSHAASIPLD